MRESIAIDLDSTLNNLDEVWVQRYNELYNDNLKHFTCWDVTKCVKPECGKKIFDILLEPEFFFRLGLKDGAYDAFKFLNSEYDCYIVTAYTHTTCVDKVRWVNKHFPFFDSSKVVFCNNKGLIDADYIIDDAPHNIEAFKGTGILIDMPYNQDFEGKCIRIGNWGDIFSIL